jgi:hypothetical protein
MKNRILLYLLMITASMMTPNVSLARYLNTDTGRFQTMDTYSGNNEDPLSLHKYLYGADNPVNMVDSLGQWASIPGFPVHQMAINEQLSFLPESDRQALCDAQVEVDRHQDASESYMHAMRDGDTSESVETAKTLANFFVRGHLIEARKAQVKGKRQAAMSELGQAMHTLQDSTSPMHHGFKPWYNYFGGAFNPNEWAHGAGEAMNPGPGSWLYKATQAAYDYFNKPNPPWPSDFFANLGGDSMISEAVGEARQMAASAAKYQAPTVSFGDSTSVILIGF